MYQIIILENWFVSQLPFEVSTIVQSADFQKRLLELKRKKKNFKVINPKGDITHYEFVGNNNI